MYASDNMIPKYVKQKLNKRTNKQIPNYAERYIILLSVNVKTKKKDVIFEQHNQQTYLIDIYRALNLTTVECILTKYRETFIKS